MNLKQILYFGVGPVGSALLGIGTVPVMAWTFSVEDVGRYSVLQMILSFSSILFTLGLDQAYVREYHESVKKDSLLKTVLLFSAFFYVCIFLIFLIFNDFLSNQAYQIDSVYLGVLTMICVFFTILIRYVSLEIRMQERGALYSLSQILPKIFFLSFVFVLYFISIRHFDFSVLILGQMLSLLLVSFVFVSFTWQKLVSAYKAIFDADLLKNMLIFGMPLVVSGLIYWMMLSSSRIVLLKISTLKEVGIFGVASSIAAGLSIFSSIFNTIWAPTIYRWVKEGKGVEEVKKVSEYIALLICFIVIGASLTFELIPRFLPKSYSGVEYVFLVCIMQPLLYTLSEATSVGIVIKRKTAYSILVSLIGFLVNLVILFLLIPKFGALGAAISMSVSFWIYFVCRTEMSCLLWNSFSRKRLYLSSFFSLIVVNSIAVFKLSYVNILFVSLTFLVITVLMFFSVLKKNVERFVLSKCL